MLEGSEVHKVSASDLAGAVLREWSLKTSRGAVTAAERLVSS